MESSLSSEVSPTSSGSSKATLGPSCCLRRRVETLSRVTPRYSLLCCPLPPSLPLRCDDLGIHRSWTSSLSRCSTGSCPSCSSLRGDSSYHSHLSSTILIHLHTSSFSAHIIIILRPDGSMSDLMEVYCRSIVRPAQCRFQCRRGFIQTSFHDLFASFCQLPQSTPSPIWSALCALLARLSILYA